MKCKFVTCFVLAVWEIYRWKFQVLYNLYLVGARFFKRTTNTNTEINGYWDEIEMVRCHCVITELVTRKAFPNQYPWKHCACFYVFMRRERWSDLFWERLLLVFIISTDNSLFSLALTFQYPLKSSEILLAQWRNVAKHIMHHVKVPDWTCHGVCSVYKLRSVLYWHAVASVSTYWPWFLDDFAGSRQ